MAIIEQFTKIRRDGKVIDESMTAKDMVANGWLPSKVTELRWTANSTMVDLRFDYGVLAKVVAGREYIALIEEVNESGQHSELWILNSDGSKRHQISSTQSIQSKLVVGEFGWFEQPRQQGAGLFGVIWGRKDESSAFHLDVDAKSGKVVGAYPIR